MTNNRRTNMQINGIPLDDIRDALVVAAVPEADEDRDRRRSADEDVELAEIQDRREQRAADDEAEYDRRNADPVGAVRRMDLRRLI